MKVYITVYREPEVGNWKQEMVLDCPQMRARHLNDIVFFDKDDNLITEKRIWRQNLMECFEDLFNSPVGVLFDDELEAIK